jgi:hypothetical protein
MSRTSRTTCAVKRTKTHPSTSPLSRPRPARPAPRPCPPLALLLPRCPTRARLHIQALLFFRHHNSTADACVAVAPHPATPATSLAFPAYSPTHRASFDLAFRPAPRSMRDLAVLTSPCVRRVPSHNGPTRAHAPHVRRGLSRCAPLYGLRPILRCTRPYSPLCAPEPRRRRPQVRAWCSDGRSAARCS